MAGHSPGGGTKGVQEEAGWSGVLMYKQTGGESRGAAVFSGSRVQGTGEIRPERRTGVGTHSLFLEAKFH